LGYGIDNIELKKEILVERVNKVPAPQVRINELHHNDQK
jgi:hypothetical protein